MAKTKLFLAAAASFVLAACGSSPDEGERRFVVIHTDHNEGPFGSREAVVVKDRVTGNCHAVYFGGQGAAGLGPVPCE